MFFSEYVIEAIASVNYLEKDRDTHAVSLLKGAAEKAENEVDSHILDVISGCLTMTYRSKEQDFAPIYVERGGRRSFGLEDLKESDVEILRLVTQVTESSWLRTRLSHIVWTITKEYHYGQFAVTGYLDAYQKVFDPVHWVSCYENIETAYHIAFMMGKKTEIFRKTRMAIFQKLVEMNGTDPLFLSVQMIKLICKDLETEQLLKCASILEILLHKNTDPENDNTHLADESFSNLEAVYKRLKREDEIKVAKERYADYYGAVARKKAAQKDYIHAVIFMKRACKLYSALNRDKMIELRLEMEPWQKLTLESLQPFTMSIDVRETADIVEQMFVDLTLSEAIVQFGRIASIYKVDEVKQRILQEKNEYFLSSMFGNSLLNDQGQLVQELPPITITDIEENSDVLRKYMVRHVAEQRGLLDSIPLQMAFKYLKQFGTISEDALDFLVQDNAIIPDNRIEIIREGLCLALNGRLYTAMHILQPQTENIFRHLVKMCGDTVTFLKEDGTEEYKSLSNLFKSNKLLECYDNDLIFVFQSIMDEPIGENLRNLNAHGLLEPDVGGGTGALCFLSMLIMLLSLYSEKALLIRMNLAKREANEMEADI